MKQQILVIKHTADARQMAGYMYRRLAKLRNPLLVSEEDFVSEAMIGLCKAALRFRASKGVKFWTFAVHCIRSALMNCLRQAGPAKRGVYARMKAEGRFPAQQKQMPDGMLTQLAQSPHGDSDPARGLSDEEDFERILAGLDAQERAVVAGRFKKNMTMKEIGAQLGVGEARVSQIWLRAKGKLRDRMAPKQPCTLWSCHGCGADFAVRPDCCPKCGGSAFEGQHQFAPIMPAAPSDSSSLMFLHNGKRCMVTASRGNGDAVITFADGTGAVVRLSTLKAAESAEIEDG